ASVLISTGAAGDALSRTDHDTCVRAPRGSVTSIVVSPAAAVRRTTSPGSTRTSAGSPVSSITALALPASGWGSANAARPGDAVRSAAQSIVIVNGPGPFNTAA